MTIKDRLAYWGLVFLYLCPWIMFIPALFALPGEYLRHRRELRRMMEE